MKKGRIDFLCMTLPSLILFLIYCTGVSDLVLCTSFSIIPLDIRFCLYYGREPELYFYIFMTILTLTMFFSRT